MGKPRSLLVNRHCQVILMQVASKQTSRNSALGVPRPQRKTLYSRESQTHTKIWFQSIKLGLFSSPSLQLHCIDLAVACLFVLSEKIWHNKRRQWRPLSQFPTKHSTYSNGLQNWIQGYRSSSSFISDWLYLPLFICKYYLHQVMHFPSSRSTCKVGKHYAEKISCGFLRRII